MDALERLPLETIDQLDLIASEHVLRYDVAASLVDGVGHVVDLACGEGYGSRILVGEGRTVVGVDIAAEAVDAATRAFGDVPGLSYVQGDAVAYLRGLEPSEDVAIVCFEGLEHLPDLESAVDELRRLASGGTRLALSVPNSLMIDETNEFHQTDFGYESARELAERFDGAVLLGQFNAEGSMISRGEAAQDVKAHTVLGERAELDHANHFIIAVGVTEQLDAALPASSVHVSVAPAYNRYMHGLRRENAQLWRTNQQLARGHRGTFDSAAAALQAKLREAEERATMAAADVEFMKEQVVIANADAQEARNAALRAEAALEHLRNRKVVKLALRAAAARHRAKPWRRRG